VCNINERVMGIKAHSVVGQEEVVIKPLGEFMRNVHGVGGATIRGDGRVVLILDVPAIVSQGSYQKKAMNSHC